MSPLRLPLRILDNRAGRVPKPSWCTFLVCNRCNARCGMCDSWKLPRGVELSPEEVVTAFGKLGDLDVVRLSGGEPFLRADLLEVAEAVMRASSPAVLHITTNGSFPDRVEALAERFSAPRRLRFMVSFDGLEEVHDASRGKRVTFERAIDTVERLVALRSRGVEVTVNHTVISAASMDDAGGLRRRMAALGVDVHAVLAYADSAMYGEARRGTKASDLIVLDGYPLHQALEGADAIGFVDGELERLPELRDRATRVGKRYYLEGLKARLRGDREPQPRPKCTALRSHVRLLPNGDVPVCQFNTEVVGNLLRDDFEALWSQQAAEMRAWVDRCSGCWAECEVMPSALYGGDLLRFEARRHLPGKRARVAGATSAARSSG